MVVWQTDEKGKKSKERLEEEKRAILKQRIRPLDIDGADAARLAERAKELHALVTRLEGEKYDLEKNYKTRQMEVSWPPNNWRILKTDVGYYTALNMLRGCRVRPTRYSPARVQEPNFTGRGTWSW